MQWVVLRRDLWTELGWPLGPVIAQACHASSAAMLLHLDDPLTREYADAANIDHMHKVCADSAALREHRAAAACLLHVLPRIVCMAAAKTAAGNRPAAKRTT